MESIDKLKGHSKKKFMETEATIKVYYLYQILKVIDLGMQRGAYKGSEASLVGALYNGISGSIEDYLKTASDAAPDTVSDTVTDAVCATVTDTVTQ